MRIRIKQPANPTYEFEIKMDEFEIVKTFRSKCSAVNTYLLKKEGREWWENDFTILHPIFRIIEKND